MAGKAPSFPFYPMDWSRDLEEHSLEIEGAWIRICCKLWWSESKGKMTKTIEQWTRILRVDKSVTKSIINTIKVEKIGDVTERNGKITICNRRMFRDYIDKEDNKLRQQKYRDKHKGNGKVTPPLSFSSSSSSSSSKEIIPYATILEDLNKKRRAIRPFTATENNKRLIRTRWNEGFKLKDFLYVHTVKCDQWMGTEQEQFLRPQTLYSNKFEGYLNQRSTKQIEADEKFRKTEKCPECGNVGPVINDRKDYPDAKKYTGNEPIGADGSLRRFCYACTHKWETLP